MPLYRYLPPYQSIPEDSHGVPSIEPRSSIDRSILARRVARGKPTMEADVPGEDPNPGAQEPALRLSSRGGASDPTATTQGLWSNPFLSDTYSDTGRPGFRVIPWRPRIWALGRHPTLRTARYSSGGWLFQCASICCHSASSQW